MPIHMLLFFCFFLFAVISSKLKSDTICCFYLVKPTKPNVHGAVELHVVYLTSHWAFKIFLGNYFMKLMIRSLRSLFSDIGLKINKIICGHEIRTHDHEIVIAVIYVPRMFTVYLDKFELIFFEWHSSHLRLYVMLYLSNLYLSNAIIQKAF